MTHLPWCPQNGGPGCGACTCPALAVFPPRAASGSDAGRLAEIVVALCPDVLVGRLIARLELVPCFNAGDTAIGRPLDPASARALEALRRARARAQRIRRRRPFAFAPKRRPDVS